MDPFDIYIAYVSWGTDGKRRPVVIYFKHNGKVSVFRVTSQYQNKSDAVRSKYMAITDWQQTGLDKPSYIDMSAIIKLPVATIDPASIGKLSERDKQALVASLEGDI
jgi:hypothetical protein